MKKKLKKSYFLTYFISTFFSTFFCFQCWVLIKEMNYKLVDHDHLDSVVHCKTEKRKPKKRLTKIRVRDYLAKQYPLLEREFKKKRNERRKKNNGKVVLGIE